MDNPIIPQLSLLTAQIIDLSRNIEKASTEDLYELIDTSCSTLTKRDRCGNAIWVKIFITQNDPKVWVDTRSQTVRGAWHGYLIAAPLSYDICFRILCLIDR